MTSLKKTLPAGKKIKNFLCVAWGQLSVAIITIIGVRIYTELLETDEFGVAMLAIGGLAFLDGLLIMAFSQTIAFYGSKIKETENQINYAAGLSIKIQLFCLKAIIPIALLSSISAALLNKNTILTASISILVIVYLITETAKAAMIGVLNINRKHSRQSTWLAVEALLIFISITTSLIFISKSSTSYIYGYLAGKITSTTFFYFAFYNGTFFKNPSKRDTNKNKKEAISYALPFSVMAVIGWLGSYADRYILSIFSHPSAVGIYSASTSTIGRPYALSSAMFSNYFRPIIFSAAAEKNNKKTWLTFWVWLSLAFALGLLGTALVYLVGPHLIFIVLAEEYRGGAIQVMLILSVGLTASIMTHALDNLILAYGQSRSLIAPQLISILTGIFSIAYFSQEYGATGAAAGKTISDILKLISTAIILLFQCKRINRQKGLAMGTKCELQ